MRDTATRVSRVQNDRSYRQLSAKNTGDKHLHILEWNSRACTVYELIPWSLSSVDALGLMSGLRVCGHSRPRHSLQSVRGTTYLRAVSESTVESARGGRSSVGVARKVRENPISTK
jgi:hypothetical protein